MIQFDEKTGIFHLSNAKMSYVMQVVRGRYLMHRYWGRKLRTFRDSRPFQEIDRAFSPQPAAYENERTFSLDVLPQEYPSYGHVDYRIPAYEVRLQDGTTTTELFYKGYEIVKGKPALPGLPARKAHAPVHVHPQTAHLPGDIPRSQRHSPLRSLQSSELLHLSKKAGEITLLPKNILLGVS